MIDNDMKAEILRKIQDEEEARMTPVMLYSYGQKKGMDSPFNKYLIFLEPPFNVSILFFLDNIPFYTYLVLYYLTSRTGIKLGLKLKTCYVFAPKY